MVSAGLAGDLLRPVLPRTSATTRRSWALHTWPPRAHLKAQEAEDGKYQGAPPFPFAGKRVKCLLFTVSNISWENVTQLLCNFLRKEDMNLKQIKAFFFSFLSSC